MKTKSGKILIAVLLVLIALLSAFVVLLLTNGEKILDNRNDVQRYYDNKCQSYATQNVNSAKGQIVFVGDSITDLYILDDHYADLPIACYNRGIGGDTTSGVLRRLKVSIFDIEPSKVVLLIGTNDINGGCGEEEILERYEQIIDEIYAALPEVDLYCVSIIPQNDDIEEYSHIILSETTAKILSINPKIRSLAEEKGATFVDLFPLLADENNHLIKEYSDDGLHLNEKGFEVWTSLMKPYFVGEGN